MTIFISKEEQDLGIIPRSLMDKGVKGVYRSLIDFEKVFFLQFVVMVGHEFH